MAHGPLVFEGIFFVCIFQVESLGQVCEHILLQHVDTDTALYLLSIADQFQSKTLKVRLNFSRLT